MNTRATKTYELSTGMELLDKPDSLEELVLKIRDVSLEAMQHARKATEAALITGGLLIEAKAQVQHGQWDEWVVEHCWVAASTARAYMSFAKKFQQLDLSNRQRVIDLPLREAVRAIATDPAAPPKPRYKSTYRPQRSDREKTESTFDKAVSVLKASKKLIGVGMKEREVKALREKLNNVIAELDRLESVAETEGGAA